MGNKLKEVYYLIADKDNYRPIYQKPFSNSGYNIATDARMIIFQTISSCDFLFDNENLPNLQPLIDREKLKTPIDNILNIEELKTTINEYINLERLIKCEACYGSGSVDYEFNYNNETYSETLDCPICDGCGKIDVEENELIKVELKGVIFAARYILKLFKIMELLCLSEINWIVKDANNINHFQINSDVKIYLVPTSK